MAGITAEVFGNLAVLRNLEAACVEIQARAQEKLEEAGQMAKERAKELCPVSEYDEAGHEHMRDTIDVAIYPNHVSIGTPKPYAKFVELGHHTRSGSWVSARPFLVPAWLDAGYWLKEQLRNLI